MRGLLKPCKAGLAFIGLSDALAMANEWYVQHGGKEHGPFTPANLKKLASDGKINPATNVRLGIEGNWVPASRVQGLFAAPPASAPPIAPPPISGAPAVGQKVRQPQPPSPPPPPLASDAFGFDALEASLPPARSTAPGPLSRVPFGSVAPVAKPVVKAEASLAAKIIGAVGLVFGILALATFWLPLLSGPVGWTGIVVGTIGLLLGIAGLIVAAIQKGSGLHLNVASTSCAAVGLVLTVALGLKFGLFGAAPPATIVARPVMVAPALPPAPAEEPEAEPEPEPEPPPEIVWTNAGSPIEQGPIMARIVSMQIENIRLENLDFGSMKRGKPQPMLSIKVQITNGSTDKILTVGGWPGGGNAMLSQVEGLLKDSELGKSVQSTTAAATLSDNIGNSYPQTPAIQLPAGAALTADNSLRPAGVVVKQVVFPPPLATIEFLRLELAPGGFGGTEPLRFEIPKPMIIGLK
jgi:hypothetical protein